MNAVITTEALTKRYGGITAVDGVHLDVCEGDLFGFLGPNGSGKTTTVRMLLGLVYATSGSIEVMGQRMPSRWRSVLPHVGALVEGPGFYPHLSGSTNLAVIDAAGPERSGRDRRGRIADALDRVGLGEVGKRPVKAYSTGMRQRLGLAAALLRRQRVLILDEPTNGLDPQGTREIRDLLTELVRAGTTVFLSSHLLSEVELVCNRAAIVDRGRLVAQDTVANLLAPTGRLWIETPDVVEAARAVADLLGPRAVETAADERLAVHLNGAAPEEINRRLVARGVPVRQLMVERPTLEQVFLDLTRDRAQRMEPPDVSG